MTDSLYKYSQPPVCLLLNSGCLLGLVAASGLPLTVFWALWLPPGCLWLSSGPCGCLRAASGCLLGLVAASGLPLGPWGLSGLSTPKIIYNTVFNFLLFRIKIRAYSIKKLVLEAIQGS